MIGVIIQARTASSRFPRKIYEDICGKYTLQRVLEGVSSAQIPHKIILAMPEYDENEFLSRKANGDFIDFTDGRFETYFGSPDDLIDRYFNSARIYGLDLVVRCTADCPMIQGKIIDEMLVQYFKNNYNGFLGNNRLSSDLPYPDGVDVEIFPYWMLAEIWQLAKDPYYREHVTPFIYRRGTEYNLYQFKNRRPNTIIRYIHSDFSFDTEENLALIKKIANNYDKHKNLDRTLREIETI
jgi:spore coat polysaccharide biosynthesis protein SpsF